MKKIICLEFLDEFLHQKMIERFSRDYYILDVIYNIFLISIAEPLLNTTKRIEK